jgi:hypothetical protein
MPTYDTHDHESTELDDRTERALTERMGILPQGGDLYTVVGENHPDREQSEYTVDLRRGRCSCADSEYRDATCKHQRRVLLATGAEAVLAAISPADVPGELGGDHLEGEPEFLAPDGSVLDDDPDRTRVPPAGGVLVYEERDLGRELVGAENVENWDALADGLAARGHGRGAVYHLEELDDDRRATAAVGGQ